MGKVTDRELLIKIGQRVKQLRKQRFLTQEELYEETNIHINRIETARINITISTIAALCRYFEISLKEFFEGIEF
jgi:transcriptional regulator with XRE-family HTH domain